VRAYVRMNMIVSGSEWEEHSRWANWKVRDDRRREQRRGADTRATAKNPNDILLKGGRGTQ
jgi:hypothetical protein